MQKVVSAVLACLCFSCSSRIAYTWLDVKEKARDMCIHIFSARFPLQIADWKHWSKMADYEIHSSNMPCKGSKLLLPWGSQLYSVSLCGRTVQNHAMLREVSLHPNHLKSFKIMFIFSGIPTTIKTMGVNITTIESLRVLIIEFGSTIILMVVEAQGIVVSMPTNCPVFLHLLAVSRFHAMLNA